MRHREFPTQLRVVAVAAMAALVVFLNFDSTLAATRETPASPTVLITGSNRGIGLEFARQYAEKGWHVIATCRQPGRAEALEKIAAAHRLVVIEKLDVTDHAEIDLLADKYRGTPIDLLINNAGISGGGAEGQLGSLNYAAFGPVMAVNLLGPLKMAEAFIDNVAASEHGKIVTLTSTVGSISRMGQPHGFVYGASKAAVDIAMRSLSMEVRERRVVVGLVSPGVVDTDFMKGVDIPKISPEESVRGMIAVIDRFSMNTSGKYFRYSGEELFW